MALNDKPGVSEETRKYIKDIAMEMGYVPNITARELSMKRSNIIGLIVPDLENPFYAKLASHINSELNARGYQLMLSVSSRSCEVESEIIENFISRRVEGIIVSPITETVDEVPYRDLIEKSGIPFIFAASRYSCWEAPCVMSDLTLGEKMLWKHLISLGHRKIMLIGTSPNAPSTAARLAGARMACEEAGFDPDVSAEFCSVASPDFYDAYNYISCKIGEKLCDCTAITSINDIMALGVMKALRDFGYSVPSQISVCGYDDLLFSEISAIPLTTVKQDIRAIAAQTVDAVTGNKALLEKAKGIIRTSPRLIVRSSSAANTAIQ